MGGGLYILEKNIWRGGLGYENIENMGGRMITQKVLGGGGGYEYTENRGEG